MKTLTRIGEKCPIKNECVDNVIFKFLKHYFLLILAKTNENVQNY